MLALATSQPWKVSASTVAWSAALIAEEPELYVTTSHFDGYAAVLCRLDRLHEDDLTELAMEAWACRAPRRLLAQHPLPPAG